MKAHFYLDSQIALAVERALETKRSKGASYSTEVLLLHCLPAEGKPTFAGVGFHATEIAELGRVLSQQRSDLRGRFKEIWFLNAYVTAGRRLYTLM